MAKKDIKVKQSQKTLMMGVTVLLSLILIALIVIVVIRRLDERSAQNAIMKEFREYMERDELSLIYYTAEGCPFCEIQTPILQRLAVDNDFKYLEVDKTKLTDKQKKEIEETLQIEGRTPTTVLVKDGKIIDYRIGVREGHVYTDWLVSTEFLPEGTKYLPEQHLNFISYATFGDIIEREGTSIVVFGGVSCNYCIIAKPILSNIAKAYSIEINYLTLDYVAKEDFEGLMDEVIALGYKNKDDIKNKKFSTPNILIIEDSKIVGELAGLQNITEYVKFFREYGLIEK